MLRDEKCVPCRSSSAAAATEAQIRDWQNEIPEWSVIEREGIRCLQRGFRFKDFIQALAFTNRIGRLAEAEDHHPAILTEWGQVTLTIWTHTIGGLHRNDFILAAKIDSLEA